MGGAGVYCRPIMAKNKETTESLPDASRWLDRLSDPEALGVMVDDHAAAVEAVGSALPEIEAAAGAALACLDGGAGRLFYAGAGTSARIGVQDGVELTPTFGWPAERTGFLIAGGTDALLRSVEDAEDDADAARAAVAEAGIDAGDCVIGLSASGSTPYTCAAVAEAREHRAATIGIASNPGSRLAGLAEHPVTLATGGEVVAGSTRMKAGTAQKIALNLVSTLVMVRMGRVRDGMMVAMRPTNAKLRKRRERIDEAVKAAGGPSR